MKADERGYRRSLPAGYADGMQGKSAFTRKTDEQIKSLSLDKNPLSYTLHPTPKFDRFSQSPIPSFFT
jgi:hypothetical protein